MYEHVTDQSLSQLISSSPIFESLTSCNLQLYSVSTTYLLTDSDTYYAANILFNFRYKT